MKQKNKNKTMIGAKKNPIRFYCKNEIENKTWL